MASERDIDIRQLARNISIIENKVNGYEELLSHKESSESIVIGITGAPGSGKSTLADALIQEMISDKKKVAVLCVDPSSPFSRGAVLGDRIRMNEWYNHPDVFIRSFASRGSLGGLHPNIIEVTEFIRHTGFEYIIVETVGVGQSEVDIAALADITIVVLVPEGGDSIQSMKSGLMEIADVFVVNKSDRPDADTFYNSLKKMISPAYREGKMLKPVFKTVAVQRQGAEKLYQFIRTLKSSNLSEEKRQLLVQRAYALLQSYLMESVNTKDFKNRLDKKLAEGSVDLFSFVREYAKGLE